MQRTLAYLRSLIFVALTEGDVPVLGVHLATQTTGHRPKLALDIECRSAVREEPRVPSARAMRQTS